MKEHTPMLEVQKFLKQRNNPEVALEELNKYYGINYVINNTFELIILNYDQINSKQKNHIIVRECRGLVLTYPKFELAGRSFFRFFNYEECLEQTKNFNWMNFFCQNKEDGSLITLFYYNNQWHVTTRGSFANGEIGSSGLTWKTLFFQCVKQEDVEDWLDKNYSYVFELVSPYNKVVRNYTTPSLFLLTVVHTESGKERILEEQDAIAQLLNVQRPNIHVMPPSETWYTELAKFLEEHPDKTFEGFVVCDNNGCRLKIKNKNYLILHRMRGNGEDIFHPKNLIPFILKDEGEESELFTYFNEVRPYYYKYKKWLEKEFRKIDLLWTQVENIKSQKDFAFAIAKSEWTSTLR